MIEAFEMRYVEINIVIIATIDTRVEALAGRTPSLTPKTTTINENSLICVSDIPVRKPALFLYPKAPIVTIMIIGLTMTMRAVNTIAGTSRLAILAKTRFEPSEMKNIIKKKSRSGLVLAATWVLYGRGASETPARKAPISAENPSFWAKMTKQKHHARLVINRSSWDRAILEKALGRIYFAISHVAKNRIIALPTRVARYIERCEPSIAVD
jgi:hypothetical protein